MSLQTPVAFIVFNRPEVTTRSFAAVAAARPARLILIADGPRFPDERQKTDAVRRIVSNVDWPCLVETDFADHNLGCRRRVASGLHRVFSRHEQAIVLEDDCVPEPSFFRFCEELLEHYRTDRRVSMVSGDNFQPAPRSADSYYFSGIAHVWGWATWRRVWSAHFDAEMRSWPEDRDSDLIKSTLIDPRVVATYQKAFDSVHSGKVDTWDAQWQLAVWRSGGLVALPNRNLVTNLGFGQEATHTKRADHNANLPTFPMAFPLRHPANVVRDCEADLITWRRSFV